MAPRHRNRPAAKSLTTLFDKAAIQRLNSKQESTNDLMRRFFKSISLVYNQTETSTPEKTRLRRKTEPLDFMRNLNASFESGVNQFLYASDVSPEYISLSRPKSILNGKQVAKKSWQDEDSIILNGNSADELIETVDDQVTNQNAGQHVYKKVKAKEKRKAVLSESSADESNHLENNSTTNTNHVTHTNFVQMQKQILKEPIFFGSVMKHKFNEKVKSSINNRKPISESLIDQVIKRYNKKLLLHYHKLAKSSEANSNKITLLMNSRSKSANDMDSKIFWKKASRNCEFCCPQVLPPQFEVTQDQFNVYVKCTSNIEKLQNQRRQKVDTIKCYNDLLKNLESLKKANNKFAQEKCKNFFTAQIYAKNLSSALGDAKTIAIALSDVNQQNNVSFG